MLNDPEGMVLAKAGNAKGCRNRKTARPQNHAQCKCHLFRERNSAPTSDETNDVIVLAETEPLAVMCVVAPLNVVVGRAIGE